MHPDDEYLDQLRDSCLAKCKVAMVLLNQPVNLKLIEQLRDTLYQAAYKAQAIENELINPTHK